MGTNNMKNKFVYHPEDWENLADSFIEFKEAIDNASSENEKEFLEQMMYKIPYEMAASNEILLKPEENEDNLYILRVGSGDFIVGQEPNNSSSPNYPYEIGGLLGKDGFLGFDLFPYLHRHITVLEWLRERDYKGIQYNRNND